MPTTERAETLKRLHEATEILQMVNVWDPISTKVVAAYPASKAIATAGHSIAASHGYADGQIPRDLMLEAVKRIVEATDLPVTADLDDGYGDPGDTIRRAIGVGVVGANVEDRMRPLEDSVRAVEEIVAAGEAEGVAFQLNARTDAVLRGGERPMSEKLDEAIERAERSWTPAPASCSSLASWTGMRR